MVALWGTAGTRSSLEGGELRDGRNSIALFRGGSLHIWREGDLGVWTAYVLMWAGPQPDRAARLAVRRTVATLHRAYAFWHWSRTVPWQPFPVHAADRRAWTQALLPPE